MMNSSKENNNKNKRSFSVIPGGKKEKSSRKRNFIFPLVIVSLVLLHIAVLGGFLINIESLASEMESNIWWLPINK